MAHGPAQHAGRLRPLRCASRGSRAVPLVTRGPGRALRLARLRERLADRPRGVGELARSLGVTRRTIERDLQTLREELGVPVEVDPQHRHAIKSSPSPLNDVEALATYSAVRLLVHTGIGEQHYRSSMNKLARQLPEPARGTLMRSVERLRPAPEDRVLDQVAQAWFQRRVLRCRYRSQGRPQPSRRDLEIYFFELNRDNHEPYVLAYDRTKRKQVLVLKLARMSDVHLLDETYEVPDDFDADALLENAFGVVVGEAVWVTLRVSAEAAPRIREMANAGLVIEEDTPDGGLIARRRGTLDDTGRPLELLPWILGWGPEIEVLDPPEVRRSIADALRRAATRYGDG
jgi:predicted DNA-binding transcriptional regulator YafY